MTLSLPIVVGKKYVRRDGVTVATSAPGRYYAQMSRGPFVCVAQDSENRESGEYHAFASSGRILPGIDNEHQQDLVSDYIELVNGHPHAALMMEFAKDALESETPWDLWEERVTRGDAYLWVPVDRHSMWHPAGVYRRKPTVTPDPHAENAAEYAKDMAETDKAWQRWEVKCPGCMDWEDLNTHPCWFTSFFYRRKGSL